MHYLRKLERERRGTLAQDDPTCRNSDGACPASPLKVENPTGLFLDQVAGTFAVTLKNGKRGVQASNFMDRLLTASPVVEPAPSRDDRRGGRGSKHSITAATSLQSIAGALALRQSQVVRAVDEDDGDRMMSARSGASSSATSAALAQQPQRRPLSDPATTHDDDGDDDGFERIDRFFSRMRQDLREMRRLNVADMLLHGTPRASAARGRVVPTQPSSVQTPSSAASLHPLIRVDAKKREATNELFASLQRPAVRDTVRADVMKHLEYRDKKYHHSVHLIIDPARALLETMWEQHRVPQAERSAFASKHFNNGDISSFNAISLELQRYHRVSDIDLELTRAVQLRESLVGQLKDLLANRTTPLEKLDNGGGGRGGRSDATQVTKAEGFVMTILNSLLLLRHVTCTIVEMVFTKRTGTGIEASSSSSAAAISLTKAHEQQAHRQRNHQTRPLQGSGAVPADEDEGVAAANVEADFVLLWRDKNYLHTMQSDLDFLQGTVVSELLGAAYRLRGNPLTLPAEVYASCERTVGDIQNRSASVEDALHRFGRGATSAVNGSHRHHQHSIVSRASTPQVDGGGYRPTSQLSAAPSSICALSERPESRCFSSTLSSKRAPSPQASRVVCIREGEEVVVARPTLEDVAFDARSVHGTSPTPIGRLTPNPSASVAREQYFAKLRKEELMRTRRIDMDRSNVYVYPASVYKTKPLSTRATLSMLLQRSLDPRIPAQSYDDVTEYEQLQFGRLSVPPSVCNPWENSMVDVAHHCFRTVRGEIPIVPYSALMKREILLFAEETVLLRASAHRKLRRGLERFKMAYRGFVCAMHRRRVPPSTSEQCIREFLEWVRAHAPNWVGEARAAIGSGGDDDMQLMGVLTSGE